MIRWGVIGAGGIADRRTIPEGITKASGAKLVAVMDVNEARVREVSRKYGDVPYYTKEEDLLKNPEVDAVYIATPTHLHHKHVTAAAEAGKHVLCEKPMAMTLSECEQMIEACERNKVKLALGFMMRFHSYHKKIKEMIDQGMMGQLVLGRAQLTCWYPPIPGAWRQVPELGGGGSLADMGSHCIDLLEMFMGNVVEVSGFTGTITHGYPVEDSALVMLKFESGAHAVVDNNFNIPDAASRNVLELYGTKGSIIAEGTIGQSSEGRAIARLETAEKGYEAAQKRTGETLVEEEIKVEPVVNIYKAQIEQFMKSIEEDSVPLNSGERGMRNLKIVQAAYESARTGRKIRID
ncbi:MAG TPA: Gfo/Idh/MocA family oxidoreductase [Firmicutes bacterium]|nr:Gfo/Idh/MocA family oxidoreductase [Bacillota bacterium]